MVGLGGWLLRNNTTLCLQTYGLDTKVVPMLFWCGFCALKFLWSSLLAVEKKRKKKKKEKENKLKSDALSIFLVMILSRFDKTHIARADHYRDFVLSFAARRAAGWGKETHVRRGNFIEDTFGQVGRKTGRRVLLLRQCGLDFHVL